MKFEPAKDLITMPRKTPAMSSHEAYELWQRASDQSVLISDQIVLIGALQAEVAELKAHIASRKLKGGRPTTPDNIADLNSRPDPRGSGAGLFATRDSGAQCRVGYDS